MNIGLYADNTIGLNSAALCDLLNATCTGLRFTPGKRRLSLEDEEIAWPDTYRKIPAAFLSEATTFDLALIATTIPYKENAFWQFGIVDWTVGLVSLSGWNQLTDVAVVNGFVYFIASIVSSKVGLRTSHEENTGCLKALRGARTSVDASLRAAFICRRCRNSFAGPPDALDDVERLLNLVSAASRSGIEVLEVAAPRNGQSRTFDVFLCHNSEDKPAVRQINAALRASGVVTWFDEEQLQGGQIWQLELEKQIDRVQKACVFVGPNGRGPWQEMEIRALLSEFVRRGCTVIPALLPGTPDKPDLPIFLREMMWVDLRQDYEHNLERLIRSLKLA